MRIMRMIVPVFAFAALSGSVLPAQADSTINDTNKYAWAVNGGWINARADVTNGAVLGQYFYTGYVWSANNGWICLGNGPTNGWLYSNASATDWGVNHDGQGHLSGYAYGANIGWITFEQVNGVPMIDLRTGNLSGYAYGANIGWVSLSNAQAYVKTDRLDAGPDADGDGLPDPYEYRYTNTLTVLDGRFGQDSDGDGATDLEEAAADTNPLDDGDCLKIVSLSVTGQTNTLSWTARPTQLYRLEATNTLTGGGGVWEDSGGGLIGPPAASPAETIVNGVTQTSRFYRVRAVVPLSESE